MRQQAVDDGVGGQDGRRRNPGPARLIELQVAAGFEVVERERTMGLRVSNAEEHPVDLDQALGLAVDAGEVVLGLGDRECGKAFSKERRVEILRGFGGHEEVEVADRSRRDLDVSRGA